MAVAVAVAAGCSSNETSAATSTARAGQSMRTSPPVSSPPLAAIVGRWEQVHTCRKLVHALDLADLGALAPLLAAGSGGGEDVPRQQIIQKAKKLARQNDVCVGAWKPNRHYHFFAADGRFGSLDQNLQQVDDGTYTNVGDTLVFGTKRFRYRVIHGDTLTLESVITSKMRRHALARPFNGAWEWLVSVAYAGSTWKRVPCNRWC